MNPNTQKYMPAIVVVASVLLIILLNQFLQQPLPVNEEISDQPAAIAGVGTIVWPQAPAAVSPQSEQRKAMEAVRTAHARWILKNREYLDQLEQTPEGQKLVENLRENTRKAEEAYQRFLKQDAERQRLHADLARLRESIQRYRQTRTGQ